MSTTYLQFGEQKFWEITVDGARHTVRFGKLGTQGQTRAKAFDSPAAADLDATRLIRSKRTKGYAPLRPTGPAVASEVVESNLEAEIRAVIARFESTAEQGGVVYELRPPATAAQLDALEKHWGRPLPPSYRALLRVTNGIVGFAAMRLLGTEDHVWSAGRVDEITDKWEEGLGDYAPETFAQEQIPVLVPDAHDGIRQFYTFERSNESELNVVGWEHGMKELPRSFLEMLDEEADVPDF